eukprot:TRINITY_DN862_c0_g1_i1.p1 TRINITY_DN862_c0_g1~~TRINITY_DN862_c0_g1_i1.p1  ORF type:complete len:741 (+),score=129.93 TRINITY_DN862_c0_g1_i1:100-2322(+)
MESDRDESYVSSSSQAQSRRHSFESRRENLWDTYLAAVDVTKSPNVDKNTNSERLKNLVRKTRPSMDVSPRGAPHQVPPPPKENTLNEIYTENKKDLLFYFEEIRDDLFTSHGWMKILRYVKSDIRAILVGALVGLPYCIALGVAAGVTPTVGVITCIWGGVIGALFQGCPFNIIGPSGALSGILSGVVARHNASSLPWLSLYVGFLSFWAFLFKLERFVLLIPSAVVEGFTLGVAIILFLNQVNFACGLPTVKELLEEGDQPPREFVESVIVNVKGALEGRGDWISFITFLVVFTILMVLMITFPKIPWIVGLAGSGIVLGYLSEHHDIIFGYEYHTLNTRYQGVRFQLFQFPEWHEDYYKSDIVSTAVSLTFVCILETMISAKIADGMTKTKFRQSKEMFAVSISNVGVGLAGGFPSTASLPRTALNINSGATSRCAAFFASVLICALAAASLHMFDYCPLPMVAAMICVVALRMVEVHHITHFWKMDKVMFCISLFVAAICIYKDPTIGIAVGMIISLLMYSERSSKVHSELVMTDDDGMSTFVGDKEIIVTEKIKDEQARRDKHLQSLGLSGKNNIEGGLEEVDLEAGKTTQENVEENEDGTPRELPATEYHEDLSAAVYRMAGQMTYVNAFSHRKRFQTFDDRCNVVIISMRYLYYIDIDGMDVLGEMISELHEQGKRVFLTGVNIAIVGMMVKAEWYSEMMEKGEVFPSYLDALHSLEEEKKVKVSKLISVSNY